MKKIIKKDEFVNKGKNFVFKLGPKQILLIEVDGELFALDNRCPHEGYPLSQGTTEAKSCVLTCNWHNWKFDLKTGECKLGADNVNVYPVEQIDNEIIIDLSPAPLEVIEEKILKDLKIAFLKRQFGRVAREIARLFFNKIDPLVAVKMAIMWSYDKFEFGMTHAYAATADWLTMYKNASETEDKIICLTEAIDHMAHDSLRHSQYSYCEKKATFSNKALLAAIEAEDLDTAEALIISGLNNDKGFNELEEALSQMALAHYNDFGHSLIYVTKVKEILDHYLGDKDIERALILALVRSINYATREDLIPEFKEYALKLSALEKLNFGKVECVESGLKEYSLLKVYDWVLHNAPQYSPAALYDELLRPNAVNMAQFDMSFQQNTQNSVADNVGWLDFTHALTFSNAVRKTCQKYPSLWPKGLLQMASFVGRNNSYCDRNLSVEKWEVADEMQFKTDIEAIILDHGLGLPIFSAHVLKTSQAVFEEVEHCQAHTKRSLLAALNRFIASPVKQKHVRRLVSQGIQLVSKDF